MTNETKWTYAADVTLESSGASVGTGAFLAATNASVLLSSANHSNYPYADFVLKLNTLSATIASNANAYVALYRVDQDMGGVAAADGYLPSALYRNVFVGSFTLPNSLASTSTDAVPLLDVPIGKNQRFSLENSSAVTLVAGWSLVCTPKAIVPG